MPIGEPGSPRSSGSEDMDLVTPPGSPRADPLAIGSAARTVPFVPSPEREGSDEQRYLPIIEDDGTTKNITGYGLISRDDIKLAKDGGNLDYYLCYINLNKDEPVFNEAVEHIFNVMKKLTGEVRLDHKEEVKKINDIISDNNDTKIRGALSGDSPEDLAKLTELLREYHVQFESSWHTGETLGGIIFDSLPDKDPFSTVPTTLFGEDVGGGMGGGGRQKKSKKRSKKKKKKSKKSKKKRKYSKRKSFKRYRRK